jgi:EAL domain-containing protein (putative c-di-GMP-specific phosphodiesterase class I)
MAAETLPYRESLGPLCEILERHGSLGLLLVDVSQLAQVERDYGSRAYEKVLGLARDLVLELKGSEIRESDMIAMSEKGGDAFLIFLSPKRYESHLKVSDLQSAANRVSDFLNRRLGRLTTPYLSVRREVTVGFSIVFLNPLVMGERLVARLVQEAWECVRVQRTQSHFQNRCRLQAVLLEDQLSAVFQPVVELSSRAIHGYEALCRGPVGSSIHSPTSLFAMAAEVDLVFELDRGCRRRALLASKGLPPGAKLFINVLPSCMYDPEFQGASLIRLLEGLGLAPERIVLEINEKYAIENYKLFVEALQNLTQIGFEIAIDDIGAGYSSFEKIAHLNPRYLKFDMQLVRDIDGSYVRREMARALKDFARKMDSRVIAEGIEREGELEALLELGIEYGQGFLLGRPTESLAPPVTVEKTPSRP